MGNVGGTAPNQPQMPFNLLRELLNPANARQGDAVFSQEAFDRVVTQLMEQNGGSTAPGPASEDAIQSLRTKQVDREMMGNEGKAECSICMDNVEIGDEVTVLPCNHWFHGQCVKSWLGEHDTCPHCRKSITQSGEAARPAGSRRRSSRRSSSVTSPRSPNMDGSRRNPFRVPGSPSEIRGLREDYYERRDRERDEYDRSRTHRPSSQSESRHTRNGSGGGGSTGSGGSADAGGGVTGWLRNHLPFQG